jgi:hypothetical protein
MHAGFDSAKTASGLVGQRGERLEGDALLPGRAIPPIAPA